MNPTKSVRIEKITLNIGAGKDQSVLNKGVQLIKHITGISPVKTITNKRIPAWGLRKGLPIGCKLTLRRQKARDMLVQLLRAKDNVLLDKQFDENGNLAFGIHEYIDIPDVKYVPEIGVMGFEVCVTLERVGYRIKRRRIQKKKIPIRHKITKVDAINFMKKEFNVNIEEEE